MKPRSAIALIVLFASVTASREQAPVHPDFDTLCLTRSSSDLTTAPTSRSQELEVYPSGAFRLEVRVLDHPGEAATRSFFGGQLTGIQKQSLTALLAEVTGQLGTERLGSLRAHGASDSFKSFGIAMVRGRRTMQLQYLHTYQHDGASNAVTADPDAVPGVAEEIARRQKALAPAERWFDGVIAGNIGPESAPPGTPPCTDIWMGR
jgi:hypothetical protein